MVDPHLVGKDGNSEALLGQFVKDSRDRRVDEAPIMLALSESGPAYGFDKSRVLRECQFGSLPCQTPPT